MIDAWSIRDRDTPASAAVECRTPMRLRAILIDVYLSIKITHDNGTGNAMTKPLNDQERFGLQLGVVARLWRAEIDRRLAAFGVTESRWLILLHLSRLGDAATQRELAEAVGVRGPSLVHTLDRLEAEGLIERRTTEAGDRRTKSVHLRAQAVPVLAQIETTTAAVRAEILSDLSDAEVTICARVFEKIAGKLRSAEAMQPAHRNPTDG